MIYQPLPTVKPIKNNVNYIIHDQLTVVIKTQIQEISLLTLNLQYYKISTEQNLNLE